MWRFGEIHPRKDIHTRLGGGNNQSGIAPVGGRNEIAIFSNKSGEHYGYEDKWTEDGLFEYTGAGQEGDQDINNMRHNGRILHHLQNEDRILLFRESRPKARRYRYEGELTLVDHEFVTTPDKFGKNRKAVRFIFEPVTVGPPEPGQRSGKSSTATSNTTTRQGLVTSRVGQGRYRRDLINRYRSVCGVTQEGPEELLIASHIVPWRESNDSERLDVNNGILLSPNYDALFDRNLISFDVNGAIMIGKSLTHSQRTALGVSGTERIQIFPGMERYLSRHRAKLR